MLKKIFKSISPEGWFCIVIAVLITLTLVFAISPWNKEDISLEGRTTSSGPDSILTYVTSGANEVLVWSGPVFLDRILIGNDLTGGALIIADATSSVSSPFFQLSGDAFQGVYEIGVNLLTGICVTASPDLWATFIYTPK